MLNDQLEEPSHPEASDQLEALGRELSDSIKRAKTLAISCKIGHYEESEFKTTPSGVSITPRRNC
jgi:hypothetical protein